MLSLEQFISTHTLGAAASTPGLLTAAYIIAAVLFIMSLGGLSTQETARRGNWYGIVGMTIALIATFFHPLVTEGGGYGIIITAMVIASGIGITLAARVGMTSMPELVAILHSFVGLAAVLVGISGYLAPRNPLKPGSVEANIHNIEVYLGVWIGAITFTGSVIAYGKLRGKIASKPLMLPGRHFINLAMLIASIGLVLPFLAANSPSEGTWALLVMTLIALFLGYHLVMSIGGADMPVVVSMLNSYSGWAAAATGFMLGNDLLIVVGALVGSSGAILSYIMCRAMNRSIVNVIFGGFGATNGNGSNGSSHIEGEITQTSTEEVGGLLKQAKNVVIIPGYGMAVAQAQHGVYEITNLLRDAGAQVRFAIHPVAGRLPGHMNVLLAEAKVPYDIVLEMDEINEDMPETDIVLVIGANDIVNPSANDDMGSPIYGMPVIHAWEATDVIVFKRSMGAGYSGVDNPLFYKSNTRMLFGDAKASVDGILSQLRA